MPTQALAFRQVRMSLRPARVAVLIPKGDPGWTEMCQRVIEWLSGLWGGEYSLIVPTDGLTIAERFWYLLERFDPDYIYGYRKTMLDFKIAKPEEYAKWLDQYVKDIVTKYQDSDPDRVKKDIEGQLDMSDVGSWQVSEELEREILRRFNPFHREQSAVEGHVRARGSYGFPLTALTAILPNAISINHLVIPGFSLPGDLQLLAASVTGLATSDLMKAFEGSGAAIPSMRLPDEQFCLEDVFDLLITKTNKRATERFVLDGQEIPEGDWRFNQKLLEHMPFAQSMLGLRYYFRDRVQHREPIILVVGDTVEEFCLYFCLSRMKWDVYWLPARLHSVFMEALQKNQKERQPFDGEALYLWRVTENLVELRREYHERRIWLTSMTLTAESLESVRGSLNDGQIYGRFTDLTAAADVVLDVERLLPYVRTVFELENHGRPQVEQFFEGTSANFLNTPKPRTFEDVPPTGHHWISEAAVEGHVLPRRGAFAAASIVQQNYDEGFIRITRDGFGYFCPNLGWFSGQGSVDNILARPKIRLLDAEEIFKIIYSEAGFTTQFSDKGNYQRETTTLFGGLQSVSEVLRAEKKRQLLEKYLEVPAKGVPKKAGTDGAYLDAVRRRYLDFPAIQTSLGSAEEAGDIIDQLIANNVITRGLIFRCERCAYAGWYPIAEVTQTFRCGRCRTEQRFTRRHWRMPEEPSWCYELNEVIYQGLANNMSVPILTAAVLQETAKGSFFSIPETELRAEKRPKQELDLTFICDGEIGIAECTTASVLNSNGTKENAELNRLREVADLLRAKHAVFSTLADSWEEITGKRAATAFQGSRARLRWLVRKDLLEPHAKSS